MGCRKKSMKSSLFAAFILLQTEVRLCRNYLINMDLKGNDYHDSYDDLFEQIYAARNLKGPRNSGLETSTESFYKGQSTTHYNGKGQYHGDLFGNGDDESTYLNQSGKKY